jgi:hypothetical protein
MAHRSKSHRQYWRESLGISILTPLGYILVLFAMNPIPQFKATAKLGEFLETRFSQAL